MIEQATLKTHLIEDKVVSLETNDNQRILTEEHQPAGVRHGHEVDDTGVRVIVDKDEDKAIGMLTSADVPTVSAGDTALYATGAGKVIIQNKVETMQKLIELLIDAIIDLHTAGSPANHIVAPNSKTILESLKARFNKLLKESD